MGKIGKKVNINDKEKQAYAYYLSRGWSAPQAAGIVGNLIHESGLNTSAEGDIGYKGGSSRGIAQFRGERLDRLKKRYGDKWTDFNNQLEFVDWELNNTHKSAGNALRSANDVYNAGRIVSDKYEIPAVKFNSNKDRQNKVFNTYNKLSGFTDDYSKYATKEDPKVERNTQIIFDEVTGVPSFIPSEEVAINTPEVKGYTKEELEANESIEKVTNQQQVLQDYFTSVKQPEIADVTQNTNVETEQFPTLLDQYNQVSQIVDNPIAQEGGSIEASNEFLKNWYKDRIIPDKDLNQVYQKEKNLYINQSGVNNPVNYLDQIDGNNGQGEYNKETGNIDLINNAPQGVYTHEKSHAINIPLQNTQTSLNAYSQISSNILPKESISNQWIKDNYNEISNYNEVIPRLNSYRQLHGLKPDQVITPELIKQNRTLYSKGEIPFEDNTDQLYKLFEDEGLSNVLNKVVSNDNLGNYYAQQGGKIPVSSNGVYDYPMQEVIVPTKNGNITMNNVNYPIIGIDEFGNQQMMMPGQEYKFPGNTIYEIPQLKNYFNKR